MSESKQEVAKGCLTTAKWWKNYHLYMYPVHLMVKDTNFNCCFVCIEVFGPVNSMGSCRMRSLYLTTLLPGGLSPLRGYIVHVTSIVLILSPETDNCPS